MMIKALNKTTNTFSLDMGIVSKLGLEKAFLLQWLSDKATFQELDIAVLEKETTLSKFAIRKYIRDLREKKLLIVEEKNGKLFVTINCERVIEIFG